ncbi:uncharacterized protein LOC142325700 [Lycorma delicatula]|uniref:uncharacterized protein LOC142325700 n=1 Tax=Lycorma delicatula TaxID=130591 RepID=UPI003F51929F
MKKRSARTETHSKRQQQPLSKSQSQTFPSNRHELFGPKKPATSRTDLYCQLSTVFQALLTPPPSEPSNKSKKTGAAEERARKKPYQKPNELKVKSITKEKMADEPEAPPAEAEAPAEEEAPAAVTEGGETEGADTTEASEQTPTSAPVSSSPSGELSLKYKEEGKSFAKVSPFLINKCVIAVCGSAKSRITSPRTIQIGPGFIRPDDGAPVKVSTKITTDEKRLCDIDCFLLTLDHEGSDGSQWNNFPLIDSAVLKELKEANAKAIKTSILIETLRKDILKFRKKKDMTENDLQSVKRMNYALSEKLSEFEQIADNIQRLLGIADLTPSKLAVVLGAVPPTEEFSIHEEGEPEQPVKEIVEKTPEQMGKNVPSREAPGTLQGLFTSESEWSSNPGDQRLLWFSFYADFVKFNVFVKFHIVQLISDKDGQIHLTPSEEEKLVLLEDTLPKIIVCGSGKEKEIPKIIVCSEAEKQDIVQYSQLTERLSDSYKMQEKLVTDNAEMEGSRYQLQEELLSKDRALETLQKQVECLQTEMKLISKENADLQKKLLQTCQVFIPSSVQPPHPPMCKKELYMKFVGALPDCDTLKPPSEGKDYNFEKEILHMEDVVNNMKNELSSVQEERKKLSCQAQMLQCCFAHLPTNTKEAARQTHEGSETINCIKVLEAKLKEVNEQYSTLNNDYKDKLCEISCLRTQLTTLTVENEQLTERSCCAEATIEDLFARIKVIDSEKEAVMVCRDKFIDMQQQVIVIKQTLQSRIEEIESLKMLIEEQKIHIEDYKEKYLKSQQTVEEQKIIIEKIHSHTTDIQETLIFEIQVFKKQMQEKIEELVPLVDKLKKCETKLQIAHHNVEDLTKQLIECREETKKLMEETPNEKKFAEELHNIKDKLKEREKETKDLKDKLHKSECIQNRYEEAMKDVEWKLEGRSHEITQLKTQMDTLRQESARQLTVTKERCQAARKLMLEQISILEKELIESRAAACAAEKEKEEIQLRMHHQITVLGENFNQAQLRIKCLQNNIHSLKSSSSSLGFP